MKLRRYVLYFVVNAFLLLGYFSFGHAAGEIIEAISSTTPSMGQDLTISGSGLNSGATPIVYPQGGDPNSDPNIIHYPTPKTATDFDYTFTVGTGEGASLTAGQTYTFSFMDGPSVVDAFVDFTIAAGTAGGSGSSSSPCSDTDPSDSIFVIGTVNINIGDFSSSKKDYCGEDDKTLYQVQCGAGDEIGETSVVCDYGCGEGVCLSKPVETKAPTCSDDDEKDDVFSLGTVKYNHQTQSDYCGEDDKTVYQAMCGKEKIEYDKGTKCDGACFNGVCTRVKEEKRVAKCEAEDPNADPYIFGTVFDGSEEIGRDSCDNNTVYQAFCTEDNKVDYRGYNCPFGCENGVCKSLDLTSTFVPRKVDVFQNFTPIVSKVSNEDFLKKYEETKEGKESEIVELGYKKGDFQFRDVNSSAWYFPFVDRIAKAGVVKGRSDQGGMPTGFFDPAGKLNAAEAHKFVLGAAQQTILPAKKNEKWFTPVFNKVKDLNLSSKNFSPSKLVTRGDVACMIAETLNLKKINVTSEFSFNDLKITHPQFKCFGAVLKEGIMKGDGNGKTIRPDGLVNRAEMTKMMNLSLDKVNLSQLTQCPKNKDVNNLRVYDFRAEPVYAADKKLKKTADGNYYVKVTAQIQNMAGNDLANVKLSLLRHDVQQINGSSYKEVIKQVRVPYEWGGAVIRGASGKIETFTAEVPVPKATYLSDSTGDYIDFTVLVDLPGNLIKESVDLADNISSARAYMTTTPSNVVTKVDQRSIQLESSNQKVSLPLDKKVKVNIGAVSTGYTTISAFAPYANSTLKDVEFAQYGTAYVNPHQPHSNVFNTYFRGLNIKSLDSLSKACVNFVPTKLSVSEKKVEDDGRLEVRVRGVVRKTGAISMPNRVVHAIYAKEKNSNKPWRQIYFFSHPSTDDGSKDPLDDTFDFNTLIKVGKANMEFKIVADVLGYVSETNESDNTKVISESFSYYEKAKAKVCKYDYDKHNDIWVSGLEIRRIKDNKGNLLNNKIEVEAIAQMNSGSDAKGIKLSLYRYEVDSQKDLSIVEVPVKEFQSVDLPVGTIKRFKAQVSVPTSYQKMLLDGNNLGFYFSVAADLPTNKIKELDEIGNNVASNFISMRKTGSTGDFQNVILNNKIKEGGSLTEIGGRAFGWRNWYQFYASKHKINRMDNQFKVLHEQCTSIEHKGPSVIQQLKSSDAGNLKYHVEFKLKKRGYLPLPKGLTIAELMYRPGAGSPWTSVYKWEDYRLNGDDGIRNLHEDTLVADVEFKAKSATQAKFMIKLDPNNELPKTNQANLSAVYTATPKVAGKVDLTLSDAKFGYIKLLKSKNNQPTVLVDYTIRNLGSDDIKDAFKVKIKDRDTKKTVTTFNIPYVNNGVYKGSELVELSGDIQRKYAWTFEVDPDKDIPLDTVRHNNTVILNPWTATFVDDQGVDLIVGKELAKPKYSKWTTIPLTHRFYNLNDKGNKYYSTSQKFPLSPALSKEITKNKPHFSGTGYHQFIWKTIKYVEDYYESFLALKGGVIRIHCEGNCKPTNGPIKGYTKMEVNEDHASKTIYVPFGMSSLANREGRYSTERPHESKFIDTVKENTDYWRSSYFGGKEDKDIRLAEYTHHLNLETGGGKNEYIIYTYLSQGWISFFTPNENLDSSTWWGGVFDIFEYGRTAFAKYKDDWAKNNYQAYHVFTDKNKVTKIKKITAKAAYELTKKDIKKYGDHFKEFIDQYK